MNGPELVQEIVGRLALEVQGLREQVQAGQVAAAAVEGALQGLMRDAGAQLTGVLLEAADGPLAQGRIHEHRTRSVVTVFGPVDICRARYANNRYPLDEALGLAGRSGYTVAVQEALSLLGCHGSFASAADLAGRLLGLSVTAPSVQKIAEAAGQRALGLSPPAPTVTAAGQTLVLQTDGCQAPHRDGWHEVKIGTLFLNESRAQTAGGRRKILAKEYLAAVATAEVFGQGLWQAAERWGIGQAQRVVVMGDGAVWIWNLAEWHFPEAIQIVDFYHATEHLWEVAEALWGPREHSRATRDWVRHYRHHLRHGRVDLVIAALQRGQEKVAPRVSEERAQVIRRNLGYFQSNRHRMAYEQFRRWRLPIGTGAVEGSCKFLVQDRFKKPGARWGANGLRQLLALKLLRENQQWENLWPHRKAA